MIALVSLDLTLAAWLVISLAVVLSAAVQSKLGFGVVLLILPVLLMVDPSVVPGPILVASAPLGMWMAVSDWGSADLGEVTRVFVARSVGVLAGVALLKAFTAESLVVFAGVSVLVAVVLSVASPGIQRTPSTLTAAGFLSGTFGTAVGIGGPPLALVYQNANAPEIRGNLGMILFTGLPMSLALLAYGGFLGAREWLVGISLWPAIAGGVVVGWAVGDRLDDRVRPFVLAFAAVGAVIAMGRTLF